VKAVVVPPPARHPLLFLWLYRFNLPLVLAFLKPDIYIGPDGFLPAFVKTRMLAVIHDLNFEHFPELLPGRYRRMYKRIFPKYAQRADRIATVSMFSRNDIINTYHVDPEKIDVVYNGASDHFKPLNEMQRLNVRDRFTRGRRFFIHVGTLHPRKNIARLLQAWDIFKQTDLQDTCLVLAGAKMWWTGEIEKAFSGMKHKESVILTGRLTNEDLAGLMAAAHALLLVSVFEGFGIPVVEAFRCAVPVIVSNTTSLPEVAGDAGILVDPLKPVDIAAAITCLNTSEEIRNRLILKAIERSEMFTWEKTASLLWNSIEKLLYH
jgi:glycosyltransferase involved in cell wall biosynthesis